MKLGYNNPFKKTTDGELRKGFVIFTAIVVAWLIAVLLDSDQSWIAWILRGGFLVIFAYWFYEYFREMKQRRRKP